MVKRSGYVGYIAGKEYPDDKRTQLRRVIPFTLNTTRQLFVDWMWQETRRPGFGVQFEYYPDHPAWRTPARLSISKRWPEDGEPERVSVELTRTRLRDDGSVEIDIPPVEGFAFQLAPLGLERISVEASCHQEKTTELVARFCRLLYRMTEDWPECAQEIHPYIAEVYPELLPSNVLDKYQVRGGPSSEIARQILQAYRELYQQEDGKRSHSAVADRIEKNPKTGKPYSIKIIGQWVKSMRDSTYWATQIEDHEKQGWFCDGFFR